MEINLEYLNEFCEFYGIFSKKYLTGRQKSLVNYHFGVPIGKLNKAKITNINQLEKAINEFGKTPSDADKDSDKEFREINNMIYNPNQI